MSAPTGPGGAVGPRTALHHACIQRLARRAAPEEAPAMDPDTMEDPAPNAEADAAAPETTEDPAPSGEDDVAAPEERRAP